MIEQIAFDNISIRTDSAAGMTSHSVSSDSTLVLAGAKLNTDFTTATATYNGVDMTNVQVATFPGAGNRMVLFYLENPATGAQTFSVSYTGNSGITSGQSFVASFKKSAYVDLTNRAANNAATANSVSQGITNVTRTGWIFAWEWNSNNSNSCSFANGTDRLLDQTSVTNLFNTQEIAQAGTSTTKTATIASSGTGDHMIIVAEIHPKNSKGLITI